MEQPGNEILQSIIAIVRILVAIYCFNKAKDLNRSKSGWGVFGFFIPLLAIIWIQFIKPIINIQKNEDTI